MACVIREQSVLIFDTQLGLVDASNLISRLNAEKEVLDADKGIITANLSVANDTIVDLQSSISRLSATKDAVIAGERNKVVFFDENI
jgi:hypothetical protein